MTRRRLAAVPDKPQRVVLYVRVSAVMGRGGDDFHSPDVQTAAMRRITSGMQEVAVIDDDIDQTGRTFSREGIDKIRKLAEARQIDAVAVYNVSRFGRNVLESLQFLNWLAERGVTIVSASEHIDTSTPAGRWMLTNMLAIAEMRSDEIGNEWSNTIHHRARAGKPHGRAPLGYQRGEDGRLTPHPLTAQAVRRAFANYADEKPLTEVRRELRMGSGLKLSQNTLRKCLTNRVYLGEVRVGTAVSAGAHEPLVDEDTWVRVQARANRDARRPPRLSTPMYALSGLTRCASCKGPANYVRGHDGVPRIYCRNRRNDPDYPCQGLGAQRAVYIEEAVRAEVAIWVGQLRGNVSREVAIRAKTPTVNLTAVKAELKSVRSAILAAARSRGKNQMSEEAYEATIAALSEEEAALAEVVKDNEQEAVVTLPPEEAAALGERLLATWPQMDGEQKNRALQRLLSQIWVSLVEQTKPSRTKIFIDWR